MKQVSELENSSIDYWVGEEHCACRCSKLYASNSGITIVKEGPCYSQAICTELQLAGLAQ